jgi:hypothetical protein
MLVAVEATLMVNKFWFFCTAKSATKYIWISTAEKSELVILTKNGVVFVNLQKIMMFCFLRL